MAKKEIEKAFKKTTKKDSTKKTPRQCQKKVKKHITVVEVSPGVFIEERRLSKNDK